MICPNCNSENVNIFLIDPIECSHCNKTIDIDFCRCSKCNSIFKSVNGEVDVDSLVVSKDDFTSTIDDVLSSAFVDEKKMLADTENSSMGDVIHKCVRCNKIAYEVSEGEYECPNCNFSWEVVGFG